VLRSAGFILSSRSPSSNLLQLIIRSPSVRSAPGSGPLVQATAFCAHGRNDALVAPRGEAAARFAARRDTKACSAHRKWHWSLELERDAR
jgi:hypothetical protein